MSKGVNIAVDWDGLQVTRAEVHVDRPLAAQLFAGRPAAQVTELLPRLYSLCGRAQGLAARLALAAARHEPAALDAAANHQLLAERAQEHLWRLLRDWPPLLGVASRDEEFAGWYRRLTSDAACGAGLAAYVDQLLGMPYRDWVDLKSREAIARWAKGPAHAARLATPLVESAASAKGVRPLAPIFTAADFAVACTWDADFPRRPEWDGAPAETGAYARWAARPVLAAAGGGLLGRLLARFVDLGETAQALAQGGDPVLADACTPAENTGLARVDTARGVLLHRIRLDGDTVADYAVVAPTEWNFHPQGGFALAVGQLAGADEAVLRNRIGRWVTAFDPCVEWSLEIRHA